MEKSTHSRVSGLAAPTMLLRGHSGEVFAMKFSPDGMICASASHDKSIFLWRIFSEACENFMMIEGHQNAVVDVHWTQDGDRLISCSSDRTVRLWDARTGRAIINMKEHTTLVNSCCPMQTGLPLLVSGADDGCIKVWDTRAQHSVLTVWEQYPVTAVAFGHADNIFTGGIDNRIGVWDLRRGELSLKLPGHSDTVTGLRVNPEGTHLLSNSMDNTLRIWDIRAFAPKNRCVKVLTGHMHTFHKNLLRCDWSTDGTRVSAGSGDNMVYVWDVASKKILYKLSGHTGSVNEVVFHPSERIIGSCSTDKQIYLGELAE